MKSILNFSFQRTRFLVIAGLLVLPACLNDQPADPAGSTGDADDLPELVGTLDEELSTLDVKRLADDFQSLEGSSSFGDFQRVDRMGMPAVATAVITSKDAYNQADPVDDAAGTFVSEIVTNVGALHAALDDDLTGAGLTPCATPDCVSQAAPLVVPDAITIDVSKASGFPNGRRLTDTVIDITLAVVLLDLRTHSATTLVGVNPTENDRRFRRTFPYLACPHR
jgi:hypothetical protein